MDLLAILRACNLEEKLLFSTVIFGSVFSDYNLALMGLRLMKYIELRGNH